MNKKKLLFNLTYCLAGLLLLLSLGFNIYQYQRNRKLIHKPVPARIVKTAQKMAAASDKAGKPKTDDIDKLEDYLDETEEALDDTSEMLSEELTQQAGFRKAYEQYSKNLTSNPAFQKNISDSVTQSMLKGYDPLFKKLNISKEGFDEFKALLADRTMEIQNALPPNIVTLSDEERGKMNQRTKEIRDRYDKKITEFLGQENNEIYQSYRNSLSERSSLAYFMETVPPENRITEEQTEALIDAMYSGRKQVYDKMGPDIDIYSPDNLTRKNVEHEIEKTKLVYDKYMEAAGRVLPVEQAEQYNAHLKRNLGMAESSLKTRLFMKGNK